MIVVGAKGMAKEVLEILSCEMNLKDNEIVFFDNINKDVPSLLFNRFKVLKDFNEVKNHFKNYSYKFTLGLGNPINRRIIANDFIDLGGDFVSVISKTTNIGSFNTVIGRGCQIMQNVVITNQVTVGKGVLININSTISHECLIGDFVEIACGVNIPGNCKIGKNVFIGTNALLNPGICIGNNSIIGSGSVVLKDVPSNVTVVGNPAKTIIHND